jgi:hypothetical protein
LLHFPSFLSKKEGKEEKKETDLPFSYVSLSYYSIFLLFFLRKRKDKKKEADLAFYYFSFTSCSIFLLF